MHFRQKSLPALMASIRQLGLDGELRLGQNDGERRLFWDQGSLIYLQSDVAGEQFGNYLLRQGILDFSALSELLANDEQYRLGEKVVQWGMITVEERDCHLLSLQEQIMIHALEHEVLEVDWHSGSMAARLSQDLHFKLDHRVFIWNTFQEAHNQISVSDLLYEEAAWKWIGRTNLLDHLADLPLNPNTAFALAFLGTEPVSFETFLSLSRLPEPEAACLLVTLWALGVLTLIEGPLPVELEAPPQPPPVAALPTPPEPLPELDLPSVPAMPPPTPRTPLPPLEPEPFIYPSLDPLPVMPQPEFIEIEPNALPLSSEPAPEAVAFVPMDAPAKARKLVIKAKQLLAQERTVEAIRTLEQSVQLDPEAGSAYEAWLLLGRLRMSNPAWSTRAIDALQNASRLRLKAAEPWASMGEVYYRKGFKANAVACFNRALELDPSVPIPPDVDLQEEFPNAAAQTPTGLFQRFKAMLGRPEKN